MRTELIKFLAAVLTLAAIITFVGIHINSELEASAAIARAREQAHEVWETADHVELAAMSSAPTSSVSGAGAAVLGTGAYVVRTTQDQTIHYIERLADGSFKMGSLSAEHTVIYEIDDGSDPRIEYQTCHLEADDSQAQALLENEHNNRCEVPTKYDDFQRVAVYVPPGTIADTYSLGND